jgi:hypothetical protein
MSQIKDLGPAKTWNSNRFTNSEEPRPLRGVSKDEPKCAAYPSRLAEDGEHLRMTVVVVAVTEPPTLASVVQELRFAVNCRGG